MSWGWTILVVLWSVYAVAAARFITKAWNKDLQYLRRQNVEKQIELPAGARYDIANLSLPRLILGTIFLVPVRLVLALPFLAILFVLVLIMKLAFNVTAQNNQTPRGKFYLHWQVGVFKIFLRPLLWCLGITWINYKSLRITDVIGNYKPTRDVSGTAPIVVSNHTSWLDMFFYLMFNVSFLSKSAVAKIPYIGMYAVARQCLFLDRGSEEDRSKVMGLIKNRTERIKTHDDVSPLLIFPEGTVTNGRTLMSFKKGAFVTGDPIKIYVLKYNTDPLQFVWSISNMNALFTVIFGMSQLHNTIDFIQYEDNLDPLWVYASNQIDSKSEDAWLEVAKTVKSLMAFAGGLHCDESTHRKLAELYEQSTSPDRAAPK